MKIERHSIQACCGKTAIIFKTDQPLTKNHITFFINNGFIEQAHFTKAGILYVDNLDFILTGPIGSNRLTVKCKHNDCVEKLNNLEALLQQTG